MPEETIFQKPNTTPQPPLSSPTSGESFFSRHSKLFKTAGLIFVILTIIFSLLTFVFPKSEKPTDENTVLTYWGWDGAKTVEPLITEFEKENPRIKVNYVRQDPEDYVEKLNVRIPNGNGPDIFRFHNTWYFFLSGVLLPLPKETIERKEFEDSFYNVSQKDLIKNGAIYGIPLGIDTLALYVNPDLFAASAEGGAEVSVPTTWQQFIDISQALTKRNDEGKIDIAGAGIGTFENINHAPDLISLLFTQNGVDFENLEGSRSKIVDALRFYTNFALLESNVWDGTLDPSLNSFAQGKVAMYFGYSRDYSEIKRLNPGLNFEIFPVPQLVSDKNFNIASYFAEGVSSKGKYQKEALLFMKFLARPGTQEKFYQGQNFVFVNQADTAVSSPFVDGTYNNGQSDELNNYLKDSINLIFSGKSEEEAADALIKGYSQIMTDSQGMATGIKE